ncbi:hypothetical protein EVAR_29482_1 [Eumeta japonica]|uniref:Uncharacterized protein n=1 Tax=Eumeta variegata TaxID=151549 RepID=A0A4C1WSE3_EUMVA|nr:hypothetical protein EVAR_29482_1 [Eumeta japonica]
MSLKVHMLHAHLDKFKDNLGAYSEEQGERFHQDVMNFEKRYQGQYNENMMNSDSKFVLTRVIGGTVSTENHALDGADRGGGRGAGRGAALMKRGCVTAPRPRRALGAPRMRGCRHVPRLSCQ